MMTSMRRYLLLTILVCHSPMLAEELPRATPEDVGMSSERLGQITEFTQRHVDEGKHAGLVTIVARHGKVVHFEAVGNYGIDNDKPMEKDTLFRIFSMTKPVTSVALMMLYEEGKFHMGDPVSNFIPAFGDFGVHQDGEVVSTGHEVTIEQLLTHTAGLTYEFFPDHEVDQMYRDAGLMDAKNLNEFMQILSLMPLKYEPGTRYHYSVATDVLGALVEVMSKQTLDEFFHERIFAPLGMSDTFFDVPDDKLERLASNHVWNYEEDRIDLVPKENGLPRYRDVTLFSGGGGLVSTAMDYMIFCEMLRSGGTYNGARILGPKTVRYMTMPHLTPEVRDNGATDFPSVHLYKGHNFGLGFSIVENPGIGGVVSSKGAYSWGGVADTRFWIDPEEDLVAMVMGQLLGSPWETRFKMKVATYQALEELGNQAPH